MAKTMELQTCADLVRAAKAKLGDPHMSDREFGARLGGLSPSAISNARYGTMSDSIAVKIAELVGIPPGLALMIARTEREKDPEVRKHLVRYLGKVLAATGRLVVAAAVALGLLQPVPEAHAFGGSGRF